MPNLLDEINVHLVDSVETASQFLSWLGERRPHIAIDTETTGLKWTDTVRLVQFGDARTGWAIPTRNWRGVVAAGMDAVVDSNSTVVMCNAKFDMHKLENDGFAVPAWRNVQDTAIRSRIADPNLPAGLKPVCKRLFGPAAVVGQNLLKLDFAANKWNWSTVPDDTYSYWAYSALDTCLTALAEDHYAPLTNGAAYEREMAVVSILYGAEKRGMRIDPEYTDALLREWRAEAQVLLRLLQEGGIKNPSSNAQVTEALKEIGWEPEEFTEKGAVKLDKAILLGLEGRFPGLSVPLLRYRRLIKWCSTYLDTFLRERDSSDHYHGSINTMGTRTGRMTSQLLQVMPRGPEIRNCIIPDEGYDLYSIDYNGMELVGLAHFSKDPELMDAFRRGEDLHTYCASLAYGVPQDKVTSEQRSIAKNTNFARAYGAGPAKIASTAGVDVEEIRAYKSGFDARFPGVQEFIDTVQNTGKMRVAQDGEPWIRTSGGRKLIAEHDKVYKLVNFLIQGSCADIFKDAIIALDAEGMGDTMLAPVHDEMVFQFPSDDGPRLAQLAKETMEDLTSYRVPFTCDVDGPLARWGQKYE